MAATQRRSGLVIEEAVSMPSCDAEGGRQAILEQRFKFFPALGIAGCRFCAPRA